MKKLYLLFCLFATPLFSLGQSVPSGDFENWTPTTFHKLDAYQTSIGKDESREVEKIILLGG